MNAVHAMAVSSVAARCLGNKLHFASLRRERCIDCEKPPYRPTHLHPDQRSGTFATAPLVRALKYGGFPGDVDNSAAFPTWPARIHTAICFVR